MPSTNSESIYDDMEVVIRGIWVPNMKTEKIKRSDFYALPEFSATIPTLAVGMIWRRNLNFTTGLPAYWVICKAVESTVNFGLIMVEYLEPEIVRDD